VAGYDHVRGSVVLGVRPGDLRIASDGIPAQVDLIDDFGDSTIVNLLLGDRRVKVRADQRPGIAEGQHVFLSFAPDTAHLFDRQSGLRL
jgi:ABC-type sugar transport system ATPase subunit